MVVLRSLLSFIDPGNTAEPRRAHSPRRTSSLNPGSAPIMVCGRGRLPQPSCASGSPCTTEEPRGEGRHAHEQRGCYTGCAQEDTVSVLHGKGENTENSVFYRKFLPGIRSQGSNSQEGHFCVFGKTATEDVTVALRSLYVKLTK